MAESDDLLMRRLRGGDTAALAGLVLRHQRPLLGFLARLTGDRQSAEDLAQETFLRVLQSSGRYAEGGPFRSWLFTIAYRLHLDARRRARRQAAAGTEAQRGEPGGGRRADLPAAWMEAGEEAERLAVEEDLGARVRQAIDRLPEPYRAILVLRGLRELPYAEAGKALGCSAGAARVRMHKGLSLLRQSLKEAGLLHGKEPGDHGV